ncbi:MAG: MmcQ/YjbR family DNA-binding protein [Tepidiformaceae bacterium]
MTEAPVAVLRRLCMAFPDTTERLSHGEPTWFARGKKTFVMFANHHHDDRLAFWCAAPAGAQEVLVGAAPGQFFVPPYVGVRGWLGVWLDVPVDWDELAGLVAEAHATIAATMPRPRNARPNAER